MAVASALDESWGVQPLVDGGGIIGADSADPGGAASPSTLRETKAGLAIRRATQPPNRDCIKHNAKPVKFGSISSVAFKQQAAASGGMHETFTLNGDGPFMHDLDSYLNDQQWVVASRVGDKL